MTSPHSYLTVEVTSTREAHTVNLIGEADLLGAPRIEAALTDACEGDAERIILDLRKLTFIDSSGLRAVIRSHEQCVARGRELRVIRGPANVQRLFELSGMSEIIPFCDAELAGEAAQGEDPPGSA